MYSLAIFSPFLIGISIIVILFPKDSVKKINLIISICLGIGLGLGITSSLAFQWLATFGQLTARYYTGELAFAVFLAFFACYRVYALNDNQSEPIICSQGDDSKIRWFRNLFFVLLVFSVATYLFRVWGDSPHGKWDAWVQWNFRARWLFRGEDQWAYAFSKYVLDSHPDYPLLLPVSVFRNWHLIGKDIVTVPILLAGFFTFGSILLILSAVTVFRGQNQGYLAAIFMLLATKFIKVGTHQYSDIPLAFYILCTIILFSFKNRQPTAALRIMYLAGLTTSCAFWTKNEGLVFCFLIFLVHFIGDMLMKNWRQTLKEVACFILGMAPILSILIMFKVKFAPPNDFINITSLSNYWDHLLNVDRYQLVLIAFAKEIFFFNDGVIILLIVYLLISKLNTGFFRDRYVFSQSALLVLLLGSYFLTYVIFSYNELSGLQWHLGSSLDRLIIQIWPSVVFLGFYCASGPEKFTFAKNGV
jgi:hypothetical protein